MQDILLATSDQNDAPWSSNFVTTTKANSLSALPLHQQTAGGTTLLSDVTSVAVDFNRLAISDVTLTSNDVNTNRYVWPPSASLFHES
jgi:hypothetical protein